METRLSADDARADGTALLDAAARAGERIAPLWPLDRFVAVNPFLGFADRPLAETAAEMARAAGAEVTRTRAAYLAEIEAGRIARADLAEALARAADPDLPATPEALIAAARAGEGRRPAPLDTVADVAGRVTGRDLAGLAVERISAFCADRLAGGTLWPAVPGDGLYAAWRAEALIDRTPELAGLPGFRAAVAELPGTPEAAIAAASARLGIPAGAAEPVFHRQLMTVGGWAAHARRLSWEAGLAGGEDPTLTDLLAIRLAWDAAIFALLGARAGVAEGWAAALDRAGAPEAAASRDLALDAVLQSAAEIAFQRDLGARLDAAASAATPAAPADARPDIQAAFCIDVRSEVFRRALEAVSPRTETIGFAGFFGVAIDYVPLGQSAGAARCPVLLSPAVTVRETVEDAAPGAEAAAVRRAGVARRLLSAWKSFKMAAVASFAFVETAGILYLPKLLGDALGLTRPVAHPDTAASDAPRAPELAPGSVGGRAAGLDLAARIDAADAILTAMGLKGRLGRILVLAGHGSTTVNNPHATGLDCGACGGHDGAANARVAAAILNDAEVRAGLAERGVEVPADTVVIPALHDTTTDEVTLFDTGDARARHAEELAALRRSLAEAGALTRAERAGALGLAADAGDLDARVAARARDWSQVRPEWGLAGCAAFVAAPRPRTAGIDLGGRAFLHSYDWRGDAGYGTLELIMTAPLVVASWIGLQYYGSSVDNRVFGSGNKVLHNVVGTVGVFEGNGGDLRTGLPWQSVHDGARLVHEPLRLTAVIEAPVEAMTDIIARHDGLRALLDNGWIHLFAMDEAGRLSMRYAGGLDWACAGATETAAVA